MLSKRRQQWCTAGHTGVAVWAALLVLCLPAAASVPVVSGRLLHLDAGAIAGLSDGAPVAYWPDLSGKGNHAVLGAGVVDAPRYKAAALNGRPVVRFGPDNSFFAFNALSTIRTAFWVCKEDPSATGNRFLLGHSVYWDFHRGWHNIWDPVWAHSRVVNGTTRLNGVVVNGTTAAVPAGHYALISLTAAGNVRADQLTRDRGNTAASWHGDIAEVLLYNRVLSAAEIEDVEFYLTQKYFPVTDPTHREVLGPDGKLAASVIVNAAGHLACRLRKDGVTVLEESLLGVTLDGADLGQGVAVDWEQTPQQIHETYPWRGLKSQVVNHYTAIAFPVTHLQTGLQWTFQCRVYNDGLAWRYIVPGTGPRTVSGEATEWVLPASAAIWYQTETSHYEGYYARRLPAAVAAGTPIGFPVTVELPDNRGYLLLTEAAVDQYSGMTLRATGTNRLAAAFENRTYYDSVVTGADFAVSNTVTTPWRITMAADTLNDLVNCDMVHNVCPPPDPAVYPDGIQTDWIKPGKATWNWWDGSEPSNFPLQKEYVDEAAALNCQYYVADGGWWGWADAQHDEYYYLKQLCDYAAQKNIRILVWAWLGSYRTVASRAWFFARLRTAGAAGVKFDFNNSESPDSMQLYKQTLLDAARYGLMINYHGMVKPAGEARTWPNEITREGVIGLEWNLWDDIPPAHYAAIPFTRLVAGHGDTTPCTLDPAFLRGTTLAFQVATAVVHHSPLLHWAEQPDMYLSSDAVEMIRRIESHWDQTQVLDGSAIGSLAAFAKRKGDEWFVGILNGNADAPVVYTLDLSFLSPGQYAAHILKDNTAQRPNVIVENTTVTQGQTITVQLAPGGGYVAHFSKLTLAPLGGWFVGPQSVAIDSHYAGADIRYTLDGTEPHAGSPLCIAPIRLNSSCLLRAKIFGANGDDHETKGWFTIIPPTPRLPQVHLSDLNWVSAPTGDAIPQKDKSIEGRPLSVAGSTFAKGLGTHADSEIVYDLHPEYARFVAVAGIDDEIALGKASVVFRVEIDGVIVASPVVRRDGRSQRWHFDLPIPPGSRRLKLVAWGTHDGVSYDHADWVNAGFVTQYALGDLQAMAEHWLGTDCRVPDDCSGMDLNRDHTVDWLDFRILAEHWPAD